MSRAVDYSLYLVTDSTPAILGGADLCDVVRKALRGGVTVVQYRDKTSYTGVMVDTARKLHAVTREFGVPLLINDRVDVALTVGCEGVHIGQDDMDIQTARSVLGPNAIIGVTASTPEEALEACRGGADYVGLGTVFATSTKPDTKRVIGTAGVRQILEAMATSGFEKVPAVCIGGINAGNARRVAIESASDAKQIAGIAVVSAIMAAAAPEAEAHQLLRLTRVAPPPPPPPPPAKKVGEAMRDPAPAAAAAAAAGARDVLAMVPAVIRDTAAARPLSHNMTNLVVQNLAANVALAVGASPIMSNYGEEAKDLAKLGGALVINMGTVTPDGLENYVTAVRAYNQAGQPVVFDPVGAGATTARRTAVKTILAAGYLDVIKGNESEIQAVLAAAAVSGDLAVRQQQRGVDSSDSGRDEAARALLAQQLAAHQKNVVILTGATDFASDGVRTFAVRHGHAMLGQVTGTGCCLATVLSAMVAVHPEDKLAACLAAMLLYEVAAEIAAERDDVRGPGTFVPAFIDELARCRGLAARGDMSWVKEYRIERVL